MLIEEWMSHPVHSVKPLDSIMHAREVMTRSRVNQLPVVRDGRLVGIITDRDLRDAFPSVFAQVELEMGSEPGEGRRPRGRKELGPEPGQVAVELVMSQPAISLSPEDTVEQAASLMRRERIGAVPVTKGGKLVGILTRSDVLDAFLVLARTGAEPDGC